MPDQTLSFALAALATTLTAASLRSQAEPKPIPLPAGPEALTMKRYQAAKAAFWSGALMEQCKVGNALRAEWHPHVEELVNVYAELFCARMLGGDRGPRSARLCDRLRELGCDDAVVQLISADVAFHQRKTELAQRHLAAATKGLGGDKVSPLLRHLLHNSHFVVHSATQQQPLAREAAAARDACLVELAATATFDGGKERFYLDLVLQSWNGRVGPDDLAAIERMEKSAGKPCYALLVLRAMYHNTMAWAARGQGPANSVSDADRRAFGEHLDAATQLLTQAHQAYPQHPEAPTGMLKNLGPAGAEPLVLRQWFDRAVAAQFDWKDAYLSYLHYLQPRWGGSQRALRDFGRECLATARFDTEVPSVYRLATHYVTLGTGDPTSVWKSAPVQKDLAILDQGCLAAAADDAEKLTATTHRVVALAIGGQAAEAAALSEASGKRFDPKALEIYGVTDSWLKKTLRPHFKDYRPAEIATGDLFAGSQDAPFPGMAKAKPLTTHDKAITAEQSDGRFARWLGDIYVAAYERAGTHDAAWDAEARALLACFGELVLDSASPASLDRAKRLLDLGCKDPLTLYAVAKALGKDEPARMAQTLAAALPGLSRSQPAPFLWWAKSQLSELARLAGRPGVGSGLLPEIREHMVAAIADPMFAGDHRRYFLRGMWGNEEFAKAANDWLTDRMVTSMATLANADPWLVNVVTGLHCARKARHLKGSANERAALLALATEHLGKAHELCPHFPEAAVGMIFVASLEPGTVSTREWFDRAIAAEIDFQPAYRAYVDSLRPRHGGSIQAMHRFAVECLASGRFDSDVPLWYARTLQRLQEEVRVPREVWASAGIAEQLERMFAGYEAAGRWAAQPGYLRSGRCVLAWAAGRYDEALAAWTAAGRTIDARWLAVAGQEDSDLIEFDLRHLDAQRRK